jgi:hypothetical protein
MAPDFGFLTVTAEDKPSRRLEAPLAEQMRLQPG